MVSLTRTQKARIFLECTRMYETIDIENADRLARVETKIDTILTTMLKIDSRINDVDCRVRLLESDKQFSKGQYAVIGVVLSIFAVAIGGWLTNMFISGFM